MYNELFDAWRFEVENDELGRLSPDFYERVAAYVRKIKEDSRLLDKKGLKARLIEREMTQVQRMLDELVKVRFRKLVSLLAESQKMPSDVLVAEETGLCQGFISLVEAYHSFARKLLQGQVSEVAVARSHKPNKRITLRFMKNIPAVIGADMKTYGPFLAEDVGSLPVENAKILVKRGLAEVVEIS